jgi:hypothetical protein
MFTRQILQRTLITLGIITLVLAVPLSVTLAAPAPQTVPTMELRTALPPNPEPILATNTLPAGATQSISTLAPVQVTQTSQALSTQPSPSASATSTELAPAGYPAPTQSAPTDSQFIPQVNQGQLPAYPADQPAQAPSGVPGLAWWEILAAVVLVGAILFMVTRQKKNP